MPNKPFPKHTPVCEKCDFAGKAKIRKCCTRGVSMTFKGCFVDKPKKQRELDL